jgi:CheY-like chemotaxis protein
MPSSDVPEAPLVLVADSDSAVADAIAETLTAAEFRVELAPNGPAALEFCKQSAPGG